MKILIAILLLLLFFAVVLVLGFTAGVISASAIKQDLEDKKNER
jgi:uncharacterized protein YneF (UPF0154 family)